MQRQMLMVAFTVIVATLLNAVGTAAFTTSLPLHATRAQLPAAWSRGRPQQPLTMVSASAGDAAKVALVAWGKKAVVVAAPVVPLPTAQALMLACTLPTLMGYWKSEYGVSYAYALATLAAGAMILKAAKTQIAMLHAGCLCLYGLRLGLFLLYRETAIPRFRAFRETIEKRAQERGSRLSRTPSFSVVACSTSALLHRSW